MSPSGGMSDFSMFDLFRQEVEAQVSTLSQDLIALEKNAGSPQHLESLMRAAHSLKGAARMVKVDAVVSIAHVMEDAFVAAQRGELSFSSEHIDVLLRATDTIVSIAALDEDTQQQWQQENDADLSTQVAALSQILQQEQQPSAGTVPPSVEMLPGPDEHRNGAGQGGEGGRGAGRTLRIDADRMSKILGMSGEMLVESRGLAQYTDALYFIKRQQDELMLTLERWRDSDEPGRETARLDYQRAAFQRLDDIRRALSEQINSLGEFTRRNSNLSNKLYHEIAGSRMRPFLDGVTGFTRMIRDLGRSLKKDVTLDIRGGDTPVDRDVLEKIKAPLNHLLRNAVDHGIEPFEERAAAGKSQLATIVLSATHGGGLLKLMVKDDGVGIDVERLREKLVEKGLVEADMLSHLDKNELLEFLFLPNFSTRDEVTEISGRGVGLDVVRDMMRELGGTVSIDSVEGKGSTFRLSLPLSLSVMSALLVEVDSEAYAFPLTRVDRILRIRSDSLMRMEGRQYVPYEGRNMGLISAAQVLGFDVPMVNDEELTVVVVSDRLDRYGVVVDRFIGQRQLSVQALDARLGKVQDVSSAALMEDGTPLLVLDVDDMVRSINHLVHDGGLDNVYQHAEEKTRLARKRILVVDDSLTVREVERELLESRGYRVETAVDGMDGWNAVRSSHYDLVVTDVDMPRMDGIELVQAIRHDLHLRLLPVMIVSYKDRSEDRRRGLDAGADYYLTKGSFHDDTLIEAVVDMIGEAVK
ncbi:MAG: hybrid sensor histidine kinase/response regulator [Gammaproteobacteria bacterium]|nr:hybrid sensor histidine kinase/response regulator [Gammaproteobacteria bacterium]